MLRGWDFSNFETIGFAGINVHAQNVQTMIKSKLLTDSAWKDVLAKNKGIKDNGLLKVLAEIKKLDDDDHDGAHKRLEEVQKLVTQLKKAKEVSAIQVVTKFLAELANATETAVRDVVKDKAEAQKTSKIALAAAEAKKKEDDDKKKGGDEEEEEESALLTTKLIPLLRSVKKGERMHTMVATSGKQAVVMLSRKPISASRRKILSDELGTSGGVKYAVGHCVSEHGVVSFVLSTEVAGMAKKLKLALFQQTGMRINKLSCRGEDGETDADEDEEDAPVVAEGDGDDDDDSDGDDGGDGGEVKGPTSAKGAPASGAAFVISATVGQGGKNLQDDVRAVQAALNRRSGAGLTVDGHCNADTIAAIQEFQQAMGQASPDGRVEPRRGTARALAASGKMGSPPPPPKVRPPPDDLGDPTPERAPGVWNGTRDIVDHNIKEFKRAILQQYANEHPELLAEIDRNVQRVDVIIEKLDGRLTQTLERVNKARDSAQRKAEISTAKTILAEYVAFLKNEPLIDHIDKNPFGVDVQVRKTVTDSLTHMIKSLA